MDVPHSSSGILEDAVEAVNSEVQPQHNPDIGSKRPHPDDNYDGNAESDGSCKRHKLDNGTKPDTLTPTSPPSLTSDPASAVAALVPALSKNQLRKQRQRASWVEKKKDKRSMRNQKRKDKQEQKRIEREAEIAAAAAEGREPVFNEPKRQPKPTQVQAPVTVIIDCQFEKYMIEKELVSLSNQVTRCYSDNKNSPYPVHMFVSSYGGHMKERNETILQNQFKSWKNVHFVEGDFVEAAAQARELMAAPKEGQTIEALAQGREGDAISLAVPDNGGKKKSKSTPVPEPEASDVDKSIVYLTADSPYTIDRLEPGTSYVIGGIIDKNREKGLCYKIAREKNVRTAKLPIGDFMVMQSRHVLATNHVMEIMLQWLETGDWGKAFMKVIPTRKGGKLKEEPETSSAPEPQSPAQIDGEGMDDRSEAKEISCNQQS